MRNSTAKTLRQIRTSGVVDLLRQNGGELGFGFIREESNRNLIRLRIDPPPEPVGKPQKTQWAYEDARRMEKYRKDLRQYHDHCETWRVEADRRIARFKTEVGALLARPSDARATDIVGAVRRADLFLNEGDAAWPRPPHRWAVFASDGLHTRGPVAALPWRSGAKVIVINGAAEFGMLVALRPQTFESIEAAFRFICALEGGKT